MYWMQFSLKILNIMKDAEPPVLSEDEYMHFLKSVKKLTEEKIEKIEKNYTNGEYCEDD